MKSYYTIEDLFASAWQDAIYAVGEVLGKSPFYIMRDWVEIEEVARKLGVRFNENGEIIRG